MKIGIPIQWKNIDCDSKVKNYVQNRSGSQIRKGNNSAYLSQLAHATNHLAGKSGRILQAFSNGEQLSSPSWESGTHDPLFRSQFNDCWKNGVKHRVHAIVAMKGATEKHFHGGEGRNLLPNPNTFGSWTKTVAGDVVTANSIKGHSNIAEADDLICDATDAFHGLTQTYTTAADTYCFSVYASYLSSACPYLYIDVSTLSNVYGYFDLRWFTDNGLGSSVTAYGIVPSVTNQKVGMFRFYIVFTATAALHTFRVGVAPDNGDNTFSGDGSTTGIYLWGATLTRYGLEEYPRAKCSPVFKGYATDTVKRHYVTFNAGWDTNVSDAIAEETISVYNSAATDGWFIEDMYTVEEPMVVLDTEKHVYAPVNALHGEIVKAKHFEDIRSAQHEIRTDALPKVFSWSAIGAGDNMPASQASDQGGIYITSASEVNVFDLSATSRDATSLGFFFDAYKCGRGIATECKLVVAAIAKVDSGSAEIVFRGPTGTTQTNHTLTVTDTSYTKYGGTVGSNYIMLRTDIEYDDVTTARNKIDILARVTTANNLSVVSLDAWLAYS